MLKFQISDDVYNISQYYDIDVDSLPSMTFTRQFSDLNDPTVYFGEFSKTLKIPKTPDNNRAFKKMFRIDGFSFITDNRFFRIITDQGIIFKGKVKILKITPKYYEIQLRGNISEYMSYLKNFKFSGLLDAYLGDQKINKDLVAASWNNDEPQLELDGCSPTDIIGFAPTYHGLNDDFDSKKISDGHNFIDLADAINPAHGSLSQDQKNQIVGDGFTDRQMGEFRSYYQKPYIYVNKIFQLLNRIGSSNNYKWNLDSTWFNKGNELYSRMIYTLPDILDSKSKETATEFKSIQQNDLIEFPQDHYNVPQDRWLMVDGKPIEIHVVGDEKFKIVADIDWILEFGKTGYKHARIAEQNGLLINVEVVNEADQVVKTNRQIIYGNESEIVEDLKDEDGEKLETFPYYLPWVDGEGSNVGTEDYFKFKWNGKFKTTISIEGAGTYKIRYNIHWLNYADNYDQNRYKQRQYGFLIKFPYYRVEYHNAQTDVYPHTLEMVTSASIKKLVGNRSDSQISMERIWPEGNAFDVILSYCKMFGLVIDVDEPNNIINVLPRWKYFEKTGIKDLTKQVDFSTVNLESCTYETPMRFGYSEVKDESSENYKNKYGEVYGSHLVQSLKPTDKEKTIFEKVKATCVVSPKLNTLQYINTIWNPSLGGVPNIETGELYPSMIQGNKSSGDWGQFYLRNYNQRINKEIGPEQVLITDDDDNQINGSTYCYTVDPASIIGVDSIPQITNMVSSRAMSLQFGEPKEVYYSGSTPAKYFYNEFWRKFDEERHSTNTKKVTVDMILSLSDYYNLKFNDRIKINNNLYYVNKIKDYDVVHPNNPVTVELISVGNIDAYTKRPYSFGEDIETVPYIMNTNQGSIGINEWLSDYSDIEVEYMVIGYENHVAAPLFMTTDLGNYLGFECKGEDNQSYAKFGTRKDSHSKIPVLQKCKLTQSIDNISYTISNTIGDDKSVYHVARLGQRPPKELPLKLCTEISSNGSSAQTRLRCRIYSVRATNYEGIVNVFLPAYDKSTELYGLFNTTTRQFYSGDKSYQRVWRGPLPSEMEQLEYIDTNHGAAIDTGVVYNSKWIYRLNVSPLFNKRGISFGTKDYHFDAYRSQWEYVRATFPVNFPAEEQVTFTLKDQRIYAGNDVACEFPQTPPRTSTDNFKVLTYEGAGTSAPAKIYSIYITDENERPLRDMVPVKYRGEYGLYDYVSDKFYGSCTPEQFRHDGFFRVDYVENTGNALFYAKDDARGLHRWNIVTASNSPLSTVANVFGAERYPEHNPDDQIFYDAGRGVFKYFTQYFQNIFLGASGKHTVEMGRGEFKIDGTVRATYNMEDKSFGATWYLFGSRRVSSYKGKIYSAVLSNSYTNDVIADFVPMYRASTKEYGFYDRKKFEFRGSSNQSRFTGPKPEM